MRAPFMAGDFPFPVKYGYAAVGRVEDGSGHLRGRNVFALHPHQTAFNIPAASAVVLPDDVPPHRAVLAANMETALNAVWDAAPGPADRIAVVGAGVVGSLVAYLCGRLPGAEVTLVDINPARAELAATLGVEFAEPVAAPRDCDLVVHASGSPDGLGTALALAGDEATVLEMSWYGDRPVTALLGGPFHSRRLRLISSQVGSIATVAPTALEPQSPSLCCLGPARRSPARRLACSGGRLRRSTETSAADPRAGKRHALSTHRLLVRSRLVHRRSSRPHHDRAFVSGRGFRARAGNARSDLRGRRRLHRRQRSMPMESSSTSAARTMR